MRVQRQRAGHAAGSPSARCRVLHAPPATHVIYDSRSLANKLSQTFGPWAPTYRPAQENTRRDDVPVSEARRRIGRNTKDLEQEQAQAHRTSFMLLTSFCRKRQMMKETEGAYLSSQFSYSCAYCLATMTY